MTSTPVDPNSRRESAGAPSHVRRARAFRWEGLEVSDYKDHAEHHRGVSRQTLFGTAGTADLGLGFESRYFEIEPLGFTSLEKHAHAHAVVVLRGHGAVWLEGVRHLLAPFDAVYVAPWSAHRFEAAADEPLGILCTVDRERDRPVPLAHS